MREPTHEEAMMLKDLIKGIHHLEGVMEAIAVAGPPAGELWDQVGALVKAKKIEKEEALMGLAISAILGFFNQGLDAGATMDVLSRALGVGMLFQRAQEGEG